jgi:hypothetical protein
VIDTTAVSNLLSVLHFGSSSRAAARITPSQLREGALLVNDLHSKVLALYKTSNSSEAASKVEDRILGERKRYWSRTRRIFRMDDSITNDKLDTVLEFRATSRLAKKALQMERLSFQYRVAREIVDVLNIHYSQINWGIDFPIDIIMDLFPDFEMTFFSESNLSALEPFKVISCALKRKFVDKNCKDIIKLFKSGSFQDASWEMALDRQAGIEKYQSKLLVNFLISLLDHLEQQIIHGELSSNEVIKLEMLLNRKSMELVKKEGLVNRNDLSLIVAIDTSKELMSEFDFDRNQIKDIVGWEMEQALSKFLFAGPNKHCKNRKCRTLQSKNESDDENLQSSSTCPKHLKELDCIEILFQRTLEIIEAERNTSALTQQVKDLLENIENGKNYGNEKLSQMKFEVVATLVQLWHIAPNDMNISIEEASSNSIIRAIFDWYFREQSKEQRRVLFLVDSLFKQAKGILLSMNLTEKQLSQVTSLQRRVNEDGKIVAKKYLKINVTSHQSNGVKSILDEMVKNGSLSDKVIDEVNEFALLQKVYIIMRLVKILELKIGQFDADLISQIPSEYVRVMFPGQVLRRKRNVGEITEQEGEKMQQLMSVAFYFYHRAVSLAYQLKRKGRLSQDTHAELDEILNSQHRDIMNKIHSQGNAGSTNMETKKMDNSSSYIILTTNSFDGSSHLAINEAILKLQLRVTKQLIILLELQTTEFRLLGNFPPYSGITKYLFGEEPLTNKERLRRSVNLVYATIRNLLSQKAQAHQLSPKQVITAKHIIHSLNKDTMEDLIQIFDLKATSTHPEKLINAIKEKLSSTSSEGEEAREKALDVIKDRKIKAIKLLVLLLDIKADDVDVKMSQELKDFLFGTSDISKLSMDFGNKEVLNNGIFCMPCFHKLYEQWKRDHKIGMDSAESKEEGPTGRMLGDDDKQKHEIESFT